MATMIPRVTLTAMAVASLITVTALGGCGPAAPTSSPPPTSSSAPTSPSAASTASAAADIQRVDLLSSGFGAYEATAIPVATLHNVSNAHAAEQVVVHFTLHLANGRPLRALDSPRLTIAPGASMAAAAICIDACVGAGSVSATLTVGTWGPPSDSAALAAPGGYACGHCVAGAQFGTVSGSVSGPIPPSTPYTAIAVCTNAAGTPLGGGTAQALWPASGSSAPISQSVILAATPTQCMVYASPGW